MAIDGRGPGPERHPELGALKIPGSRDGGLGRAAMRRRFDEAALAAAVRELRTRRRRAPIAVARAQHRPRAGLRAAGAGSDARSNQPAPPRA